MTFFDFHIHEKQRRTSMEGFDFREFLAGLPTNEKRGLSKTRFWLYCAMRVNAGAIG
jgi:hypothetical protein